MLEETTTVCPFCKSEIRVKTIAVGKRDIFVVSEDCGICKETASKIERALNKSTKLGHVKTEKSYVRLGMKDKK